MREADWPTSAQKSLGKYAQAYMAEFNTLRGELDRSGLPASLYGKELVAARVLLASDGAAVVYVDKETKAKAGLEQGVLLQDIEDETLTHLTQSATANLLKITISKAGDDIRIPPQIPDDIPREELKGGINLEVLEPSLGQPVGPTLTGMAVGPQWQFEKGIRTRMLPTRGRVFSPVVNNPPDGRPVLQFIFPFLDLIWLLDDLQLNAEVGRQWARADIEVLLLGIAAGIPQKQLAEDPFDAVATHCERVCDEFFRLIDNLETRETQVQNFLEVPANQFLVAPHCKGVFPHKPLGGNRFVPDFTVHRPDGDYHLIEIESPNTLIYQAKSQEQTADFPHAIQQVEDWLRYIDQNLMTVRNEDNMPTIYKPTGEVVIGRDKHMGDTAKIRFQFKRGESGRLSFKTYDMMVSEGRAYAASLRRMKGTIPPS
jgi:hypothetical protein